MISQYIYNIYIYCIICNLHCIRFDWVKSLTIDMNVYYICMSCMPPKSVSFCLDHDFGITFAHDIS